MSQYRYWRMILGKLYKAIETETEVSTELRTMHSKLVVSIHRFLLV